MSPVNLALFVAAVASTILVLPLLALKLRRLLRGAGGFRAVCSEVWLALGSQPRREPRGEAAEDSPEVDEMVERLLAARRVSMARTFISVMWGGICLFSLYLVMQVFIVNDLKLAKMEMPLLLSWLLALVTLALGANLPETLVTERMLPVWLFGVTAMTCGASLLLRSGFPGVPHADPGIIIVMSPWTVLYAVSSAGFCLRFRPLVATSFCLNACWLLALTDPEASIWWEGSISTRRVVLHQACAWVWEVCIFFGATRLLRFSVTKEVEAALGKCHGSAVTALLGLVCDAVVDTDHDLTLKDHCAKLAGMLMLRAGKSLRGVRLSEFSGQGDDQRRFQEAFGGEEISGNANLVPNVISVRLRDASGNNFTCALYHLPYRSITGRLNHLIGIQEASDGPQRIGEQRPLPAGELRPHVSAALGALGGEVREESGVAAVSRGERSGSDSGDSCDSSDNGDSGDSGSESSQRSRSGSVRGAERPGDIIVRAEEGLPVVVGDEAAMDALGIHFGDKFVDLFSSGQAHVELSIIEVASNIAQTGIVPLGVELGVFDLTPLRCDAASFHRCQLTVDYRDPAESDGFLLAKITVAPAMRKKNEWKKRVGPLRECQAAPPTQRRQPLMEQNRATVRL
mmetsp:Transcript_57587/g.166686  ORF Transcript_57587/g.166686 Transcript_57587/m.166686 type:complete len:628 (+) Transcript_57587:124-2007(+)